MSDLPEIVPPLLRPPTRWQRLPMSAAFRWLYDGSRDFLIEPRLSLIYGIFVAALSAICVAGTVWAGWDFVVLPLLSAFVMTGPVMAVGLYQKSRLISQGREVTLHDMLFVEPKSKGQIAFIGVLLALLAMVWIRASYIIYALFFGLKAFPGFGLGEIATELFLTTTGRTMLLVGTLVGGIFAAFSFAISLLSVPMLLDERTDAFTAMGTSMSMVWNNLPVTICWGAIVVALMLFAIATCFLGMIVVFPLLGHATWHAYLDFKASRIEGVPPQDSKVALG